MKSLPFILALLLIINIIIMLPVEAVAPEYKSYDNSISTDQFPHLDVSQTCNFTVDSNVSVTFDWYVDGDLEATHLTYIELSWATSGQRNVTSYISNVNGSQQISWHPIVLRTPSDASDERASLNTTAYDTMLEAFADGDFEKFFDGVSISFTNVVGMFFYLFLYVLPCVVIWIRQDKALVPVGLAVIFGILFLYTLPTVFVGPMILLMGITVTGIIYSMVKERSR